MGFLTDHVARVRADLASHPLDDSTLLARALAAPPARDFLAALRATTPAFIAEVKRASPSAGTIVEDRDPMEQARAYSDAGASAISVLTEPRHFHGTLADLRAARMATALPVLRKDFIVHPSQVIESRANGADAVLLIATCLTDPEITALIAAARDLGMAVLLETHSDEDLTRALATDATIVGVNARDLESLEVDGDGALARLRRIPADRIAVLESGISSREDVRAAVESGASAILVGEALMRAADPRAALRELAGREQG
jgi:indole-3-glycerol phosphate synthase